MEDNIIEKRLSELGAMLPRTGLDGVTTEMYGGIELVAALQGKKMVLQDIQ